MRSRDICHMMSSIDGPLLVDRWSPPAAVVDDRVLRGHYDKTAARFDADGWIVGQKKKHGGLRQGNRTNLDRRRG
jgi:hypothetical protein